VIKNSSILHSDALGIYLQVMITTDILIMAESAEGRSASNSAAENRFSDATEEDVFNIKRQNSQIHDHSMIM
jgi:hypothetical protein